MHILAWDETSSNLSSSHTCRSGPAGKYYNNNISLFLLEVHWQHYNIKHSCYSFAIYKLSNSVGIVPWRVANPLDGGIYLTLPGSLTIRPSDILIAIRRYMLMLAYIVPVYTRFQESVALGLWVHPLFCYNNSYMEWINILTYIPLCALRIPR